MFTDQAMELRNPEDSMESRLHPERGFKKMLITKKAFD